MGKQFGNGSSVTEVLTSDTVARKIAKQRDMLINHKEIAIVGRSNCGKSSLINALVNEKVAIASKTPGRTQQLIYHTLGFKSPFIVSLVDAPGYGFASAPDAELEKWKKLTSIYFSSAANLFRTIILLDARRGMMGTDKMLMDWLDTLARPYTICLTKADLISDTKIKDSLNVIGDYIRDRKKCSDLVLVTSSKFNYGIREMQAYLSYTMVTNEMTQIN
mmetsp:Transcript_21959/g.21658  ORF Transcript_21959/g.21658 Transcript_21959/m.21658 type:complete len:219 (-) Transcript_21959:20-676(-)